MIELRRQYLLRYITPLREGGSLPALAEANDGFKYVVKFRGAGHGTKALIADFIGWAIAERLGLKVPELVLVDVDSRFGITEPDEEIQDLLRASEGLNLGLHFLSGALTLDPYANPVEPLQASLIVWLDAYLTNVDRTAKNTNLLVWHGTETWVIDNGAALYFHHAWSDVERAALTPFAFIKDHVLLRRASQLPEADALAHRLITPDFLREVVDSIPADWLRIADAPGDVEHLRDIYYRFLTLRLQNSNIFVSHAIEARKSIM